MPTTKLLTATLPFSRILGICLLWPPSPPCPPCRAVKTAEARHRQGRQTTHSRVTTNQRETVTTQHHQTKQILNAAARRVRGEGMLASSFVCGDALKQVPGPGRHRHGGSLIEPLSIRSCLGNPTAPELAHKTSRCVQRHVVAACNTILKPELLGALSSYGAVRVALENKQSNRTARQTQAGSGYSVPLRTAVDMLRTGVGAGNCDGARTKLGCRRSNHERTEDRMRVQSLANADTDRGWRVHTADATLSGNAATHTTHCNFMIMRQWR